MGRHKRVDVRAVKHWCRQILGGLVHLHGQHPPIFHLNLNCDNIFINGNNGEVKIGELGLAAMLWKQELTAPEFLAKADMYSFGVCVLEIINLGYPYEECSNPAQICNTHISGRKPAARLFAEKCLAAVCRGLSARELLNQPFLQTEEHGSVSGEDDFTSGISSSTLCSDGSFISSRASSDYLSDSEISLKGTMGDDGSISVRLKLTHKDGQMKCIRFPFDVHKDTAAGVATEIVAELNVGDQEAARIAEMIDVEIRLLVPQRKIGRFPKGGKKTSAECRPKMRERFKEIDEKEACVESLKKPNACLDELDFKELSILSEILNSKLKVKNNSVIKRT
ncbi:hypothetical protein HPP92_020376 [Vanilla planifolia]|uniref:non-specific serine/threonine protein kinase n=1 Tax=Vanilla planifolia TaxID=51239 RepID=A0A835QAL2_VANPL|nr:hypothetical protein HPP92_020376 [Vanilla planifolia]